MNDLTALLPDGKPFDFWEQEPVFTRTLHVNRDAPAASDDNDGSEAAPFRTINRAAELAEPGTRILIHGGVYRECVRPARGGADPAHLISYEAFGDGPVVIRASEAVHDFYPSTGLAAAGTARRDAEGRGRGGVDPRPRPGHVPGLQPLLRGEHTARPAVHRV